MANSLLGESVGGISGRERLARALGGFAAGIGGQGGQYLSNLREQDKELSSQRKRAAATDIARVRKLLKEGNVDNALKFWDNRLQNLNRLNAKDQSHSLRLYEMMASGDVSGAIAEVDDAISVAQNLGHYPKALVPEVRIVDGMIHTISPTDGSVTSKPIDPSTGYIDPELKKETRALLRSGLTDLEGVGRDLEKTYGKISGLVDKAVGGNRQAVAATLISLVKLGEPNSTVMQGEMAASLNTANPMAAVAAVLAGDGVSEDVSKAVMAAIDPLNPNLIKRENVMAVAQSILTGTIPSVRDQYTSFREQATPINLSQAFMDSQFNNRRDSLFERLGRFTTTPLGNVEVDENGVKWEYQGGDDTNKANWKQIK